PAQLPATTRQHVSCHTGGPTCITRLAPLSRQFRATRSQGPFRQLSYVTSQLKPQRAPAHTWPRYFVNQSIPNSNVVHTIMSPNLIGLPKCGCAMSLPPVVQPPSWWGRRPARHRQAKPPMVPTPPVLGGTLTRWMALLMLCRGLHFSAPRLLRKSMVRSVPLPFMTQWQICSIPLTATQRI